MRWQSLVLGACFGSVFFIGVPYAAVWTNSVFGFPVYANLVMGGIGVLVILFGICILVHCMLLFSSKGKGTPVPVEPPENIVKSGLYKHSRNPIYVAYAAILIGEFMLFGQALLLASALLSIAALHAYIVTVEEKELERRFGKAYVDYKKKTPRWL